MEFGRSNYIDHTERPLHESLAYAPLNDELTRALVPDDLADHDDLLPIDFTTSYWDFKNARWVLFYDGPILPEADPLAEVAKRKEERLRYAQNKLSMEDLSPKFRETIEAYIEKINAIELTEDNLPEKANIVSAEPGF